MKKIFKRRIARFLILMSVLNFNRTSSVSAEAWGQVVVKGSNKGNKAIRANARHVRV